VRLAFLENPEAMREALLLSQLPQPAWRLIHILEREAETAIMHWHQPAGTKFLEDFDRFVRTHMQMAERVRVIRANRQESDLGTIGAADVPEALEIGAVAGVVNAPALVFQNEASVAAMIIAEHASAPVFGGSKSHFPIALTETFPPIELDDSTEAQVVSEVTDAPGHDANFWMWQAA